MRKWFPKPNFSSLAALLGLVLTLGASGIMSMRWNPWERVKTYRLPGEGWDSRGYWPRETNDPAVVRFMKRVWDSEYPIEFLNLETGKYTRSKFPIRTGVELNGVDPTGRYFWGERNPKTNAPVELLLYDMQHPEKETLLFTHGPSDFQHPFKFSSDGKHLAIRYVNTLKVFSVSEGKLIYERNLRPGENEAEGYTHICFAFDTSGSTLFTNDLNGNVEWVNLRDPAYVVQRKQAEILETPILDASYQEWKFEDEHTLLKMENREKGLRFSGYTWPGLERKWSTILPLGEENREWFQFFRPKGEENRVCTKARVWNLQTGRVEFSLRSGDRSAFWIEELEDRYVAIGEQVSIYDKSGGRLICRVNDRNDYFSVITFPDGNRLLINDMDTDHYSLYQRRRPEWWWGWFYAPEAYVFVACFGFLLWSVFRKPAVSR